MARTVIAGLVGLLAGVVIGAYGWHALLVLSAGRDPYEYRGVTR